MGERHDVRASALVMLATALLAATFLAQGIAAGATVKQQPRPTCKTISPSLIYTTLRVRVTAASVSTEESTTLCSYPTSRNPLAVEVQYDTASSPQIFQADRAQFDMNNQPTKTLKGIGNAAFSSTYGSGSLHAASVMALKGHTDVYLSSTAASVSQLVTLLKKVVPQL